jgi:hypothetical protein
VGAAIAFAIGDERATLDAIPVDYWNAFNLPRPITGQSTYQWPGVLDAASFDKELASDALLGGFSTDRVDSILGPLPPMPVFDAEGRLASSSPADDSESSARLPPDRPTADGSDHRENGSSDDIDRRPDGTTTAAQLAASGNLSLAGRTWLSAGGVGDWPQTTLAGFWRSSDIEGSDHTLVATNPDGSHFDGIVVEESGPSGPWLSMDRDGTTNGWRGTASVALRDPAGACPHWVPAVFAIRPGAMTINGAWGGKKVDPDDCKETNEPDNGPLRLERVVATTFKPLIPGKFIHLIGVPAGGSTSAQFKAAVAFSCAESALPLGAPKVTVSGGAVVETDECAYQLVVDRSGGYDITIEFSDARGEVIHTDHLHADVPPIPGLGG